MQRAGKPPLKQKDMNILSNCSATDKHRLNLATDLHRRTQMFDKKLPMAELF
jgi:hypothetical protein